MMQLMHVETDTRIRSRFTTLELSCGKSFSHNRRWFLQQCQRWSRPVAWCFAFLCDGRYAVVGPGGGGCVRSDSTCLVWRESEPRLYSQATVALMLRKPYRYTQHQVAPLSQWQSERARERVLP